MPRIAISTNRLPRAWGNRAFLAMALALSALYSPASAAVTTTTPFQGVTLIHRTETSPRNLDIWVAIIDTLAPGISFQVSPESPHANDTTIAQTTRNYLNQIDAQLAINGDFYSSAGVISGLEHKNPSGFAASLGNIYSTFDPSRPAFHVAKNNMAHVVTGTGTSPSPGVSLWNAVGGSDYLINNGVLPTYWNNPSHARYAFANALEPRTAIGVSSDRTKIAMFVVDGRQSHSGGMSFPEMANMLKNDYGMHWAINLDGGGSTTMAIDDGTVRVLNDPSDGSSRAVANSLALFARPTPAPIPANARLHTYQRQADGYDHTSTQIASGEPNSNRGLLSSFGVGYDVSTQKTRGLLSFDLSDIPFNATIHSVSLSLDAYSATGTTSTRTVDLEVYKLTDSITENDATWNRSAVGDFWTTPGGDFSGRPLSTLVAQQTPGLKTFVSTVDFTTATQQALLSGQPLNLLVASLSAEALGSSINSNVNLRFRSDDATLGQRPMLNVHYTFTPIAGDFNQDGLVDMADYVVWSKGPATTYTPAMYNTWRSNYGKTLLKGHSATAVPEPAACLLIAVLVLYFNGCRHRPLDRLKP